MPPGVPAGLTILRTGSLSRYTPSMPRYRVGTSGYNYAEWKGGFYPEKIADRAMLPYYAARLPTVEINYTFHRMPTAGLLQGWSEATPAGFRFTLKAPRRITHDARLRDCEPATRAFCEAAAALGDKLAALLFQLPPWLRKDLDLLDRFIDTLPDGTRAAFEFRHASWHDPAVFDRLTRRGMALCVADSARLTTPARVTAPYGYFRLRDEGYAREDLRRWADAIKAGTKGCSDVFVYFKHEEKGKGPELARLMADLLTAGTDD